MMQRVSCIRSSIRRVGQVANKQRELCSSFSSHSSGGNSKFTAVKDNLRNSQFASAVVIGNSPSWSDIPVGRSSYISSKTSRIPANSNTSTYVGKSSYSNNAGRTYTNDDTDQEFRSVYVHPLSQIVLEYLQDSHHEWIVANGLDQSLTLHRDGSFELKKVPLTLCSMSTGPLSPPSASSTQKNDYSKKNTGPLVSTSSPPTAVMNNERNKESNTATNPPIPRHQQKQHMRVNVAPAADSNDNMRIWTSYDEQEKKHWLTVRRGLFRQRFLLQDNLLTAWQANRGVSLPERLQVAVDEMIRAINRLEQQEQQSTTTTTIGQQWQQKGQRRFRKH